MLNSTVSSAWLHEHLGDRNLVILDCRFSLADAHAGRRQYDAGHIPGAHYLDLNQDLSSPVGKHGGRHPLPDVEELAAKLGATLAVSAKQPGIHSGSTQVVVYDDGLAFAARCWWLLRYLGHDAVRVLDGGFKGWVAAGYEVTDAVPVAQPGEFAAQVRYLSGSASRSDWVVDIEAVRARKDLPHVVLIDSREGDRYRGEREPIDPIAGHIPGAVNYPWIDMLDGNGYLLPNHGQRWANLEADEIIVYCGSGVTACANLLSLEGAGIRGAKLYAGSWSDWCSYEAPAL
jgi:thiosulfate/3-mercaptopyruvate sulfurtransferase